MKDPIASFTIEFTPGQDTFDVPLGDDYVGPRTRHWDLIPSRFQTHQEAGQYKEGYIDIRIRVNPSINVVELGDEIITALKPIGLIN